MTMRTTPSVAASSVLSLLLAPALVWFIACGESVPHPAYVRQPTSALMQVGYPPPPARVEFVPKQPSKDAVWIDGEWQWQGRRWAWRIGRWVVPPAGARFAPWMMVRDAAGVVYYAEGTWRNAKEEEVPEPAPVATGRPTISDVFDPEGETEPTGRTIRKADEADGGSDGSSSASPVPDTALEAGAPPDGG
jgi:hypothetical protein